MEIKKVGVLGCGLMGSGIAQVSAMAGCDVVAVEAEQKAIDKGFASIEKSLAKFAEKPEKTGVTPELAKEARARLRGSTSYQDLADCDIVIEAIIENPEIKKKVYAELDGIVKKDAIFATNTSSISVTELLTATKRPERFVGLHFFNPVPLMKLVEVVGTITTAPAVLDEAMKFVESIGKVPIRTSDRSGFIVNRLLVPYLLDAIRALEERSALLAKLAEQADARGQTRSARSFRRKSGAAHDQAKMVRVALAGAGEGTLLEVSPEPAGEILEME